MKNVCFKCVCFFVSIIYCTSIYAQRSVKGQVLNVNNEPLSGAVVALLQDGDSSLVKGTVSGFNGAFEMKELSPAKYILHISLIGHSPQYLSINLTKQELLNKKIQLSERVVELSEYEFVDKAPVAEIKGDTTNFNASSFKVNNDAVAEDLVSKIPGVSIENGTITAQGETVTQVLVDGKEFFGEDASIAMKNVPANIIDKVQIYDKQNEESEFTGFKTGETSKTINLKTRKNKNNGYFGKLLVGYGTSERYKVDGTINFFNGKRRISIIGASNNMNEQGFASQDILGVGNGPASPPKQGEPEANSGQSSGINTHQSVGINYSDNWSEKWKSTASYFYNTSKNNNSTTTNKQYLQNNNTNLSNRESSENNSSNFNHRVNMRLECTMDSTSTLLIIPSLSFQKNISNGTSHTVSSLLNNTLNEAYGTTNSYNSGYNFSNSMLYRKRFARKGRSLFVNFSQNASENTGETETTSSLIQSQLSNSKNTEQELKLSSSYTEPINQYNMIRVNFESGIGSSFSDKSTNLLNPITHELMEIDSTQTGFYRMQNFSKQAGLSYLYSKKRINFNMGVDWQNNTLIAKNRDFTITEKNYNSPIFRSDIFYTKNKRRFFHLGYNTRTKTPTISQLDEVANTTNAFSVNMGNNELEQQFTHELKTMFRSVDYSFTKIFFWATQAMFSNNYIGNNSYTVQNDTTIDNIALKSGAQLSQTANLKGYANINSFIGYSFPFYAIKSSINLSGGYHFTQLPGKTNDVENYTLTNSFSCGLVVASNISKNIDFNLSYKGNYQLVDNSMQMGNINNYYSGTAQGKMVISPIQNMVISSDVNLQHYLGLDAEYEQPSILWNAAIGYKFMKNDAAELKFTVYDILKQNKSISRTVIDTYISDTVNKCLEQYFMFTFSYTLRNFSS